MKNKIFNELIIAGGLLELNDYNIKLRKLQINDGLLIHTCNDYGNSLEVIKEASVGIEEKLKLISKIYYKYPDINHRRFRPLFLQLQEQKRRMGFVPKEWIIQICCFCPIKDLLSQNAQQFFKSINEKFGIKKIFLETYPIYNYSQNIFLLNNFYRGKLVFGLMGYQNLRNRVFRNENLVQFSDRSLEIIFVGILGKGIHNKIVPQDYKESFFNKNLFYFLSNAKKYRLIKGISSFSSIYQYEDFKKRFAKLQSQVTIENMDNDFLNKSLGEIHYFQNYDQYGGYIPIKNYFVKPKLFLSKLKYLIIYFLKSFKFSNNFFG